jgi:hypothetical protein
MGRLIEMCSRKIQWPTIPVWWQKKGYCSDMPKVVSAIDGTSHEIQIPSNDPQQQFDSGHRKYHCIHKNIIAKTSKGQTFYFEREAMFSTLQSKNDIFMGENLAS